MSKEFSSVWFTTIPLKKRIDKEALKNERDADRDFGTAQRIVEKINYEVKSNNGRLSLSNRFELAGLGFELKSKLENQCLDRDISIYRKEKRNEVFNSPPTAFEGYGVHKPVLSSARGFYRSTAQNSGDRGDSQGTCFSPTRKDFPRTPENAYTLKKCYGRNFQQPTSPSLSNSSCSSPSDYNSNRKNSTNAF